MINFLRFSSVTLAIAVCCAVLYPLSFLTWHDQQRLLQIVVYCFFAVLLFYFFCFTKWSSSEILNVAPFFLIYIIGSLSAIRSGGPEWGFLEVSLLICSVAFSYVLFVLFRIFPEFGNVYLPGIVRALLLVMVLRFYVSWLSALSHADLFFSPWSLLDGFSNVRHQGQFLTMVMPLLASSWVLAGGPKERLSTWFDPLLMASVTAMVFVAGTRGTIAAWLVVASVFFFVSPGATRVARRVLIALLAGYILSLAVFMSIALASGQPVFSRFASSEVFGLSGRWDLWRTALESVVASPWLGLGPMHFVSLGHPSGAHPHQMFLQIASEWGVPVLLITLAVVGVWLGRSTRMAMQEDAMAGSDLRWVLLFAIFAALVQAQVDGVLVMPYPQLWLAMISGWALAVFYRPKTLAHPAVAKFVGFAFVAVQLLAASYLAFVAFRDFGKLIDAPEWCPFGPRFWCDGRFNG